MADVKIKGLKPCPFCGESDSIYINSAKFYNELKAEHGSACLSGGCKRCDVTIYVYGCHFTNDKYANVKKVWIEKWNTRKEIENEHKKDK